MHYPLNPATARNLAQELKQIVCSCSWYERILLEMHSGGWIFDSDVYPPGGDETSMRICAECGRISPPNGTLKVCCDCQVNIEETDFTRRWEAFPPRRRPDLLARRWRVPLRFTGECTSYLANPESLVSASPAEQRMSLEEKSCELKIGRHEDERPQRRSSLSSDRQLDAGWYQMGLPSPTARCFDPISAKSLSNFPASIVAGLASTLRWLNRQQFKSMCEPLAVLRKVCKPLGAYEVTHRKNMVSLRAGGRSFVLMRTGATMASRNVSVGSGRSACCQLTLLSESERELRNEIAYYRKHGRLVPSAQRFTQANPRLAAPEDKLSVMRCFGARRST